MGIFSGLLGKKSKQERYDPSAGYVLDEMHDLGAEPLELQSDLRQAPEAAPRRAPAESKTQAVFDAQRQADAGTKGQANIWDLDDAAPAKPAAPQPAEPAQAADASARQASRARRNRTRIIGFEKSSGDIVDLFEQQAEATPKNYVQYPVGWLLVVDGPGHGHCFSLFAGMAQIGRGEDQSIQLDFGDTAISRNNHAAIVFDPDEKKFVLGHGGKANIVRLNGKPVISNADIGEGDMIKIGDTTLQLKVLCGADFDWKTDTKPDEEDDEDVAIA